MGWVRLIPYFFIPPIMEQAFATPASGLAVIVLSDSSGETAVHVTQAAICQFPDNATHLLRMSQVKTKQQIEEIFKTWAGKEVLVVYTLVLPELRAALKAAAKQYNVQCFDLLNPLISKISEITDTQALEQPGRLHQLNEAYFKRVEAVNYAVHCDDGRSVTRLEQADVVLVGVSRTSKTPSCMYLAQHFGLKAANVPVVLGVEPPIELFSVPSWKIIGLSIDPMVLQSLRMNRAMAMRMQVSNAYAELDEIEHEVHQAKKLFRELGCHTIDVSGKAVEETSSEIALYLARVKEEKNVNVA